MKWKLWSFIGILFILVGCNPKPTIEGIEEINLEQFKEIDNPEKMFEGESFFAGTTVLEAIEKIMKYYEKPFNEKDLLNIRKDKLDNNYSYIDTLEISEDKGVSVFPLISDYNRLEEEIEAGKPIFAEFIFMGNLQSSVFFYGYSENELAYMDFETGEKRTIKKSRLASIDHFKLLIPFVNKPLTNAELESSLYYLELAAIDAYKFDDKEKILKYLSLIKNNEVVEQSIFIDFLYIYYYTFHDFQPEIVEPILKNDPQFSSNPAVMEITIKITDYYNDEDKLKSYLGQLQVLPTFRNDTLEFIIHKGKYYGYEKLAEEADEMLKSRNED